MSHSRRDLLRTLALGAGGIALGGVPRSARAQPSGTPSRLIVFPIANGVTNYSDIGQAGASATDFTLGPMLQPLEGLGLRDQLVVLENLEMSDHRPEMGIDGHWAGMTQVLTGPYPSRCMRYLSEHESIDQFAAKSLSAGLNWPSLYMAALSDGASYSFRDDGSAVFPSADPLSIYQSVFGSLGGGGGGTDPAVLRRLKRRQSVLDAVSGDLATFVRRLPAEDRGRVDAHATAVREMEQRLGSQMSGSGPEVCARPGIDGAVDYRRASSLPETMRAFIDLTVASLACDQTRVVMMHAYARELNFPQVSCPWAPVNEPNWSFHELSHDLDGSPGFAAFKTAKAFLFQLAGELANKLRAIPEPSATGSTMLDHTIIYIPTEIGEGHTWAGLQFVTLGGSGLGVNTGRYLQYGRPLHGTETDYAGPPGAGTPHQRLHVAMLNALGIPVQTFGEAAGTGSGPIAGYLR